ncbi:MAG: hypothetical protein M0C28_01685 [Candidatus Moduliflexus flocculans]|nr:hypothetical protein [Candidatus Moduliflexus flocculans]
MIARGFLVSFSGILTFPKAARPPGRRRRPAPRRPARRDRFPLPRPGPLPGLRPPQRARLRRRDRPGPGRAQGARPGGAGRGDHAEFRPPLPV